MIWTVDGTFEQLWLGDILLLEELSDSCCLVVRQRSSVNELVRCGQANLGNTTHDV